METPLGLRGKLYSTTRVKRCPLFSQCKMCKMCDNYNPHQSLCQYCESGKNYKCNHNDKQQLAMVTVEKMFKRPISHPDDKAVPLNQKGTNDEKVLQQLEETMDTMSFNAHDF